MLKFFFFVPIAMILQSTNGAVINIIPYRFRNPPQTSQFPVKPHLPEFSGNTLDEHSRSLNKNNVYNNRYPVYPSYTPNNENTARYQETYASPAASRRIMGRPTVIPAPYFNPQQDATNLRSYLKAYNLRAISDVLSRRSSKQRMAIMQYYPDMKKDFEWRLHSSYRDLMVTLLTPPVDLIIQNLDEAMKFSTSIDENRLVELLGSLNNTQLRLVKSVYRTLHGRDLQTDMTRFSLNKFTDFFSSFIAGNRDETKWIDPVLATRDAESLKLLARLSVDRNSFFRYLLTSRSFDQLNRTFLEYERIKGSPIENTINRDFTGNLHLGILNIVKSIRKRANYFAEILHNSMGSLSKRDSTIIRIVVLRSEVDMGDVEDAYARLYRTYLSSAISSKTSGDFRDALLALL